MASVLPPPYSIEAENKPTIQLPNNETEKNQYLPGQQEMQIMISPPPQPGSQVNAQPVTAQPQVTYVVQQMNNNNGPNELTPSACCTLSMVTFKIQKYSIQNQSI